MLSLDNNRVSINLLNINYYFFCYLDVGRLILYFLTFLKQAKYFYGVPMTIDREVCNHIAEIVVAIAAVGALIFNGMQISSGTEAVQIQTAALEAQTKSLDAQRKAFEAQVWQMIIQQQLEISKVLIENPKLLPYFNRKVKINPDHKDFEHVMAVADLFLDFFEGLNDEYVKSLPGMEEDGKYRHLWEEYIVDQFALSPALCVRFSDVKKWYTDALQDYAKKGGCGV